MKLNHQHTLIGKKNQILKLRTRIEKSTSISDLENFTNKINISKCLKKMTIERQSYDLILMANT